MKKTSQYSKLTSNDLGSDNNLDPDKIKTTNVNVLLNRVRLDQKKTLKKKIIFSLFLGSIISILTIFFMI